MIIFADDNPVCFFVTAHSKWVEFKTETLQGLSFKERVFSEVKEEIRQNHMPKPTSR